MRIFGVALAWSVLVACGGAGETPVDVDARGRDAALEVDATALDGPGPVATGAIQIDPAVDRGPVPLFGYNLTAFDGGQGLMLPDGTWNAPVRAGALAIGADWLRFPGGTFANQFDWRTSIGPVAERIGLNTFTGGPEHYVFGLDEAAQFAQEMGGNLVGVININLGAAVAADWVEYVNAPVGTNPNGGVAWAEARAANGHPAPYGIVHWELSNEGGNGRIWQRWDPDVDPATPAADGGLVPQIPLTQAARDYTVLGGTKAFRGYQAVTRSAWAMNHPDLRFTAAPGQRRFTKLAPVARTSVAVRIGTTAATATPWTMVDDLAASSPTARHYELDERTGELRFGDGVHGAIPPAGSYAYTDFTFQGDGLKQIQAAMRAVDPNLQVSSSFVFSSTYQRNDPALRLDGLQVHAVSGEPDFYPDDPLRNMLSHAWGGVRDALARPIANTADLGLRMYGTEIHPWQDGYTDSVNYRNTAIGAVGLAATYAMAAELGDRVAVIGANYLVSTGNPRQAPIDRTTGLVRAEGWAHHLMREFTGARRVAVTTTDLGATTLGFYQSDNANTPSEIAVPHLIVLATTSVDRRQLEVVVINTTPDQTLTRTVGVAPGAVTVADLVAVRQLAGPTPTTQNTVASPRLVAPVDLPLPSTATGVVELTFPPVSITALRFRAR
jgi:alpha-L-arabinofuranosidase